MKIISAIKNLFAALTSKLESGSIHQFKSGDVICRTKAAGKLGNDASYIGEPMRFVGISNGCIYLVSIKYEKGVEMPLQYWSKYWAKYNYSIVSSQSEWLNYEKSLKNS